MVVQFTQVLHAKFPDKENLIFKDNVEYLQFEEIWCKLLWNHWILDLIFQKMKSWCTTMLLEIVGPSCYHQISKEILKFKMGIFKEDISFFTSTPHYLLNPFFWELFWYTKHKYLLLYFEEWLQTMSPRSSSNHAWLVAQASWAMRHGFEIT